MTWRDRGVADLAKVLVPRGKARAAKMSAPDRLAREPAAMSAKVMSAAAMRAGESMSAAVATAVPTAVPATVATAMPPSSSVAATTPGDRGARQRSHEHKNRNSYHPPRHGTLPAAAPLRSWRK